MLELLSKESIMSEYPLKKIIRYNHRSRLQDESVAEHTCFVSLFCLKIMAQLNLTHEQERQVLILAALHDTCESRTSDIPHDVKANYPEMQAILEKIEHDYYEENWKTYLGDVYKPEPIVYNILKLADAYSVYQWCLNEKALGNSSDCITEIYIECRNRLKKYIGIINEIIEKEAK
ncbi:MAG: HD domain-containing protein [Clostridia bacterium]|jgi:5'-deoxynucleotidase YfbR-like HD superfamily hydrolase|nr:HD domain-containing protein [Clostridia bacterium]DAO23397.1 MAG TPA: putative hydrolase [Caudoviricetes sp.]